MIHVRDRSQRKFGHIFGATVGHTCSWYMSNTWLMMLVTAMTQRQKLVTFLVQILPHKQFFHMTHETETTVGHNFGANFVKHAVVAYTACCT